MSVNLTSEGATKIITDDHHDRGCRDRNYSDSMEADLSRFTASCLESTLNGITASEREAGTRYGDTIKTVKDAEASFERSLGSKYGDTVNFYILSRFHK
jgi:hypothetical protein